MGASRWQMLRTVQLPMARRTIVVGLNQCTMAALSMATIAALINGPGLGQPVAQALQSLDIGNAFVSGIAIVIMAIMLDRTTTAASERAEVATRTRREARAAAGSSLIAGGVVAAGLRLPVPVVPAAGPSSRREPDLGAPLAAAVTAFTDWLVEQRSSGFTAAITNVVSTVLLNPLQSLLADSPWWLMAWSCSPSPTCSGGWRPAVTTLVCELRHPGHRAVERGHDDAHHDPRRDPGGDRHRGGRRGLDGPQPAGRHRGPAVPGRLPDHPAVRLPGARAGAVRHQPVHRDRRRRRVRRAGRHQADRRRHPGRVPDVGRGRPRVRHHGRGR